MLDFFKVKHEELVGVDISSSSVKVLELSRSAGQYVVKTYGIEYLPQLSIVEKNIKAIDKVADAIRRVVQRVGAHRQSAAVAVSGSSVLTRTIQLNSSLDEQEIAEEIEIEFDRFVPYPLDEVFYDFEIIGPSEKNPGLTDVLLAAARVETVDVRMATLTEAGLKTAVVDIDSLAMERAFALVVDHLPSKGMGSTIALVDIGATNMALYVFRDKRAIYNRDQVFGGKHLVDEIQRRYGLSAEEARAAEKLGGLPEDYITEVLEPFKETVVQQISRALQVYLSFSEFLEIHHIVLAGGVAMLPGLEGLIQSKLAINTFVANPFVSMQFSDQVNKGILMEDAPGMMMACGLALRTFDHE